MAKTLVSDIVVPEVFAPSITERIVATSRFFTSGIARRFRALDALAAGGGRTVNMPGWQNLNMARQIISDGAPVVINRIQQGKDVAAIHYETYGFGVNDLARELGGDDPLGAIQKMVADAIKVPQQNMLVASIIGACSAANMDTNRLSIASENVAGVGDATKLNALTFIDATAKLGDRSAELSKIAVHSSVEAAWRKADLVEDIPASNGRGIIATYQGRELIVDDGLPVRAGTDEETPSTVYTSFLFAAGAVGFGEADLNRIPIQGGSGTQAVEFERDAKAHDTNMIIRRRHITHPLGVAWTPAGQLGGESPTDAELANGANWTRVWQPKNVGIVAIIHNI